MPGYFGEHCEIEIDECIDEPCKNNGVCYDETNGYHCACPIGFEGVNCQINIDDCVNGKEPLHNVDNVLKKIVLQNKVQVQ